MQCWWTFQAIFPTLERKPRRADRGRGGAQDEATISRSTGTHVLREQFMQYLRGLSLKLYHQQEVTFWRDYRPARQCEEAKSDLRKEQIYIRDCGSMSLQFNDRYVRLAVRDDETNKRVALALRTHSRSAKEASR